MGTTTTKADELREQIKSVLTAARDIADRAEKENRDFTDAERAEVTAKMTEAGGLKKRLDQHAADDQLRKSLGDLGDGIGLNEPGAAKRTSSGLHVVRGGKSLGEHFTGSDEYKALLGSAPGGRFTKDHRVVSRPVGYTELLPPRGGSKALVTGLSDTSGGAFVTNDNIGLRVGAEAFQRPLVLRDLVTQGTTTSDTVEYVRVTGFTNAAAPVAEATATGGSSGTKPESSIATVKVTATVKTIAHWIPITKRALSDAAQIRTLIDNFLMYGLEEELEDQMISGDGTGENFEGLGNVSGVQAQAWDTNLLTTLRKAKTKVRTVGRSRANAYVLNPANVEELDLLTDNEGRFYFGGPSGSMGDDALPLWRLPVIESEAVPAGTGYVGDFRKCVLWDREQASITVSDSHGDFFVRNMVAILAEGRYAFGCLQPTAFVEIDLTA